MRSSGDRLVDAGEECELGLWCGWPVAAILMMGTLMVIRTMGTLTPVRVTGLMAVLMFTIIWPTIVGISVLVSVVAVVASAAAETETVVAEETKAPT